VFFIDPLRPISSFDSVPRIKSALYACKFGQSTRHVKLSPLGTHRLYRGNRQFGNESIFLLQVVELCKKSAHAEGHTVIPEGNSVDANQDLKGEGLPDLAIRFWAVFRN
jgi:hypothetical protein